jgi:hypothetical protein
MGATAEPPAGAPDRARELDRLAAAVMARLAPLAFDVAGSAEERDAVLRMRYECVVEEGWARPADHPDGRERDEHDDGATFVVCRDGGALVGSMRVVPPTPGRPLPVEQAFGIRARPVGGVVEVGRIVVARGARSGRSHLVLAGLAARGWLEACAWGSDRAVSAATAEAVELYRALGLRVTVLAPAATYRGAVRAPILIEGDERSFAFVGESGPGSGEAAALESAAKGRSG